MTKNPTVNKIYFLVHPGYDRLDNLDDWKWSWYLDDDSYDKYMQVKNKQDSIVSEIIRDDKSILFLLPVVKDSDADYFVGEHANVRRAEVAKIKGLRQELGDRLIVLDEQDFASVIRPENVVMWDANFKDKLPFDFDNPSLEVFGEYKRQCVAYYGRALKQKLGIDESRYKIIEEASVDSYDLIHIDETKFFSGLPGWRS